VNVFLAVCWYNAPLLQNICVLALLLLTGPLAVADEERSSETKHGRTPMSQCRWNHLFVAFLLGLLFIVGCGGPSFTKERYEQVDADMTKDEVVSVIGPGEDVKNVYTDEQIELHNLPADTTFVRWQDPDDPKALTHIGFSGGKVVHRTTLQTE
jgi:hypothetical protein